LTDFSEQHCKKDDDCSRAEEEFGDTAQCDYYVCQQGSCVPQHGVEICDGRDDDCNGLIDDALKVMPHELTDTSSPGAIMAYAVAPSGGTVYVVGSAESEQGLRRAQGVVVTDRGPELTEELSYASAAMDKDGGCPVQTSAGVGASGCGFGDVALGADREQLVYATINTAGCSDGQLRVGLATASDPFRIWLGSSPAGGHQRSRIEVGVDVGDGRCSGVSVPDANGAASGARSPAVAVLDSSPGGAGALVTWLAAGHSKVALPSCGAAVDVPVQALGVMVPEDARNDDQRWLVGSDNGQPIGIGQTSSVRPPAVVGLPAKDGKGSYLVAFPSTEDNTPGLALLFVAVQAQHLESKRALFIPDDHPDLVSLARATSGGTLAVAWRSGCGDASSLKLALLTAEAAPISSLSLAAPGLTSKPQLLHASDGFATQNNGGGWYIAWSEQSNSGGGRTQLARVPDAPSAMAPEVFTVTSGAVGLPLLFLGGDNMMKQGLVTVTGSEAPQVPVLVSWCE
jgi:hypothetical protein